MHIRRLTIFLLFVDSTIPLSSAFLHPLHLSPLLHPSSYQQDSILEGLLCLIIPEFSFFSFRCSEMPCLLQGGQVMFRGTLREWNPNWKYQKTVDSVLLRVQMWTGEMDPWVKGLKRKAKCSGLLHIHWWDSGCLSQQLCPTGSQGWINAHTEVWAAVLWSRCFTQCSARECASLWERSSSMKCLRCRSVQLAAWVSPPPSLPS